jgi:hypothetical protein
MLQLANSCEHRRRRICWLDKPVLALYGGKSAQSCDVSSNINNFESLNIHDFAFQPRTAIIFIEMIQSYKTWCHSLREQDKFQVMESAVGRKMWHTKHGWNGIGTKRGISQLCGEQIKYAHYNWPISDTTQTCGFVRRQRRSNLRNASVQSLCSPQDKSIHPSMAIQSFCWVLTAFPVS